jgi:hypothetical protein
MLSAKSSSSNLRGSTFVVGPTAAIRIVRNVVDDHGVAGARVVLGQVTHRAQVVDQRPEHVAGTAVGPAVE